MFRYVLFDEISRQLKGFLEVPLHADDAMSVEGLKILVDYFPVLEEGATLKLNSDYTWETVLLPKLGNPTT